MNVHMEFLPILQDFVPNWGRCLATFSYFITSKKQGKGAAFYMIPLGNRLGAEGHFKGYEGNLDGIRGPGQGV